MRVTFDTNVYRGIVDPRSSRGSSPDAYRAVHDALRQGRVSGFLSETVVSLEGIPRNDRGDYLASVRPQITVKTTQEPDGPIRLSLAIAPDNSQFPPLNPTLRSWIERAGDLGIKFIRLPRVAMPSPIPDSVLVDLESAAHADLETASRISRAIEARGVGHAALTRIGRAINARLGLPDEHWSKNLNRPRDDNERSHIIKAVAEWADGDTAAAHGGHRNTFLCTEDHGRSAPDSVFNESNRAWLTEKCGFRFVSVIQLARVL